MKTILNQVRLNKGGYTYGKWGQYFGVGEPLWRVCVQTETEDIDFHIRAQDRQAAKDQVLAQYPEAKFYR